MSFDILSKPRSEGGSIGQMCELINTPLAKIPAYYHDVQQDRFPLTIAEFNGRYSGTMRVFDSTQPRPGNQTNSTSANGVNEPFCAVGVGVVAIGEGEAFSVPGALITRPAAPATTPCFDGCIPSEGISVAGGGSLDTAARNAVLWWGGPTWRFIEKMFQAYRLQVAVNKRFLMVDESLFDVGMVPVPPEFVGAGDSLIPVNPSVRQTNDVMHEKNIASIFIPQNQAGTLCVGAPTANVTYGHPRIIGMANRIFCFNKPLCICPGMRWDTQFVRIENDLAVGGYLSSMQRDSVLAPDAAVTPDVDLLEGLTNTCSGFSSSFTVPGGTVSIGLVFKGFALQPSAVIDYVSQYCMPGSVESRMLQGNPYLSGLIAQDLQRANLAGVAGVAEAMQRIPENIAQQLLKAPEA